MSTTSGSPSKLETDILKRFSLFILMWIGSLIQSVDAIACTSIAGVPANNYST